jgi:NADH-quinone oxidoreductase subunit L
MMMFDLLWLIPALPLASFAILALAGGRLSKTAIAFLGVGSVGLSAALTFLIGLEFLDSPPPSGFYAQTLWTWLSTGGFQPAVTLYLDALSLLMMFVITFVGFLIHLYASEYMAGDADYARFFASMNLFVASMLVLVLADNLLLLYLGWEGVGLCSYLLIGFWYSDPANARAACKAFLVTRIGDTAMAIGLFLLFAKLGTLEIQPLMAEASRQWPAGSGWAAAAAALLLGGGVGKSAQLPLQTWLPDAMAGPTPVSALIHAATMVTAGVYLIARTHVLFGLAPEVQCAVAVIGALTLLLAGFSALVQSDIKRVLAYSTISQIGYMFLALGVGAWQAAMFHFMTHAFFKALLFLAAGAVIVSLHHEQNIFKMGGLRREIPAVFWTFLIGAASLAGLPLLTAGFYSKDWILAQAWSSPSGSPWLWAAGLLGAFLTAVYSFRLIFIVFFGEARTKVHGRPGWRMQWPLTLLAAFAAVAGFVETPETLGHVTAFSHFLGSALPNSSHPEAAVEATLITVAVATALLGLLVAYLLFLRRPEQATALARSSPGSALHRLWFSGWGFDSLYHLLFVAPVVWVAQVNKGDFIDQIYNLVAWLHRLVHESLRLTQSGQVRWYAAGVGLGTVVLAAVVIFL